MTTQTVKQALQNAILRLAPMHDNARLDAEVLLALTLDRSRAWLHTWPEHELQPSEARRFASLVEQRSTGVPVAHLTGQREFWSLELCVSEHTLIPRPETELLVGQALACIPADRPCRIADLGTGSGAIALAVAAERPQSTIIATDRSDAALDVARHNARRLGLANVMFAQCNWCAALANASLDCIISNPPYIAKDDPHLVRGDVRFEPRSALVSGVDGLDAIRTITGTAPRILKAGGILLIEHGDSQAEEISRLMRERGYHGVQQYRDLAGLLRVTGARSPATGC